MGLETKHTKGRWVYAPDTPDYRHARFTVWNPPGPFHGWVAVTCSPGLQPYGDGEEQAANARLISRASDMLAMLLRVRETCHLSEDETLAADLDLLVAQATGLREALTGNGWTYHRGTFRLPKAGGESRVIQGWRWIAPNGTTYDVLGNDDPDPPIPDEEARVLR